MMVSMMIRRLLKNSIECSEKISLSKRFVSHNASSIIENKIRVDDVEINCLRKGTGEHKLFLLPGFLGTIWTDFGPQITSFDPKEFTIVAWDPPGYGKSRPPKRNFSYNYHERDADMAVKLLKALDITKCSLLGWSNGGISSLIIAAKYPELVDKLVVSGASAFVTDEDYKNFIKVQNVDGWSPGIRKAMTNIYGNEELRSLADDGMDAMTTLMEKHNGDICKKLASKIVAPTLILYGEKDEIISDVHYRFLHESIPGSKVHLFPNGKHHLHLTDAEEFNKIVLSFLH